MIIDGETCKFYQFKHRNLRCRMIRNFIMHFSYYYSFRLLPLMLGDELLLIVSTLKSLMSHRNERKFALFRYI